jgi:hypothetical protein
MWANNTSRRLQFVQKTDRSVTADTTRSVSEDLFVVYVGKTDDYRRNMIDTSPDRFGFENHRYIDRPNIHVIVCSLQIFTLKEIGG